MHTKDAYGSLLQLVVLCEPDSKLEAYNWEELNIALSGVMHPLAVDILSLEDFGEGAEASLQALIPRATVHLYTMPVSDEQRTVEEFWKRMDSADATAGPADP